MGDPAGVEACPFDAGRGRVFYSAPTFPSAPASKAQEVGLALGRYRCGSSIGFPLDVHVL
jgi:hypothetical protein